jgi:hypothetical protein
MKARVSGIKTLGSFIAAAVVATIPQMVQASGPQTSSASESSEIASLKRQIYLCHHHKRRHRQICPVTQQAEKQTIIEKPVIIEKVVEKQVFVDRPVVVEKQVAIERPVEMQQEVIVEHSKHRRHLLHFGVPFIGVSLF